LGSVAAAGGAAHSVAVAIDGSPKAAGANWSGQCDFPAGLSNIVALSSSGDHTMILLDSGVPAPRLYGGARIAKTFRALVQTHIRRAYAFETKTNLSAAIPWQGISTNPGDGVLHILVDTNSVSNVKYYRVRRF
jgi:hypothetical protein